LVRYITIDDDVCHGKPTFKGTRILISDVIELLVAGDGAVLVEKRYIDDSELIYWIAIDKMVLVTLQGLSHQS